MTTTTYHNSPVKNCATCAHRRPDDTFRNNPTWDHCVRYASYCSTAVRIEAYCGSQLKEWRPAPPQPERRSLRQWLWDTFWK